MASREDRIEEKLREFMKVCLVLNVCEFEVSITRDARSALL